MIVFCSYCYCFMIYKKALSIQLQMYRWMFFFFCLVLHTHKSLICWCLTSDVLFLLQMWTGLLFRTVVCQDADCICWMWAGMMKVTCGKHAFRETWQPRTWQMVLMLVVRKGGIGVWTRYKGWWHSQEIYFTFVAKNKMEKYAVTAEPHHCLFSPNL